MTRGIVELAAERLAASRRTDPGTQPHPADTPAATGRNSMLPARRSSRSGTANPGTPPEATGRPASYPEPFDWATATTDHTDYRQTTNHRPVGLPASVRLPAELPDNLWPPAGLLEQHTSENLYVPPPRVEQPGEPEPVAGSPVEQLSVPVLPAGPRELAEPHDPAETAEVAEVAEVAEAAQVGTAVVEVAEVEAVREPENEQQHLHETHHEPDFLPDVLARGDDDPDYVPARTRTTAVARHAAPSANARRTTRRRRRTMLLAYLLLIAMVLFAGHQIRDREPSEPQAEQPAAEPVGLGQGAVPTPDVTGEIRGADEELRGAGMNVEEEPVKAETDAAGEFRYAKERGPMLGTAGRVHRFRVAVEETVDGTAPGEFAKAIEETLGNERSWINDGRLRLRRVPKGADNADFTIYLASARTSEQMCAGGGLHTEGFTSCRIPGKVVINADRWRSAVADYDGHIAEYRRYAINHEVGHELGHGHEQCPGEGKRAPVMMPQTYGLKGCTRNAWPYLGGKRYAGEPMA